MNIHKQIIYRLDFYYNIHPIHPSFKIIFLIVLANENLLYMVEKSIISNHKQFFISTLFSNKQKKINKDN